MIVAYVREYRIAPSRREIRQLAGLASLNQVETHVKNLQLKGRITLRAHGVARNIEIMDENNKHGKYQELVEVAKQIESEPDLKDLWLADLRAALIKMGEQLSDKLEQ